MSHPQLPGRRPKKSFHDTFITDIFIPSNPSSSLCIYYYLLACTVWMKKQTKRTANTLDMMRICLDDGKWITETAPAAVIYLSVTAAWPLACANWRGLLLGKHPHLWTELFPALLGTARSVQVSAQGQLMRCEYVKMYPLSYNKHWSLGQNMRNLVKMTNSAADMIPARLAAGWWSHLLVWDALKHGTLHETRRKQFGVVNNNFVYSSHAHEHEGGVFYNNNTYIVNYICWQWSF